MSKGHSPEQIIRKLRQAEGKLANGSTTPEVAFKKLIDMRFAGGRIRTRFLTPFR